MDSYLLPLSHHATVATRGINTKLTPEWGHKQFYTPVHILFYMNTLWLQVYSEGFTNKMSRFHVPSDKDKDDAIVVRIHGAALPDFRDRQQEFLTMQVNMMTSSNGNFFRVTGPLCGEFTGPGEFHTQRAVTRSLDVFLDLRLNKRSSKQPWGWWFGTPSWSLWRQCNDYESTV